MATFRVGNRSGSKVFALYLEPWGDDYWLRPGDEVNITTVENQEPGGRFSIDLHDDGIQLWVETGTDAVVASASGELLACGHQRPA
jgi:protein involved in polysaccharide export with SLBB domain